MSDINSTSSRLDYLDSLRGLAALSVVYSHYVLGFGLPTSNPDTIWNLTNTPLHIWWDGFAAVAFFFVLSGFVLSLKFFRPAGVTSPDPFSRFRYSAFVAARLGRILLPYGVCMLISLVAKTFLYAPRMTLPPMSSWLSSFWWGPFRAAEFWNEFWLFQPVMQYRLVPQAWTLSVELILSMFVPMVALIALQNMGWFLFTMFMAIAFLKVPLFVFHFALGIFLAKLYMQNRHYLLSNRKWVKASLLAIGLFFYTFRFTIPSSNLELNKHLDPYYLTGFGSFLLIVFALNSEKSKSLLRLPALLFLGQISYSIYLFHFLVLLCVTPKALEFANQAGIIDPVICWYLGILVTTLGTIILSTATYYAVERPSLKFAKWIV